MTKFIISRISEKYGNDTLKKRECLGSASSITGIICNILLSLAKFTVGTIAASVSITADALNNLSDAVTSIVTLTGTKLSNKPVDKEHPFGHGRIEYISGLAVSFFIFLMGFELAKSSVQKIINPEEISFSIIYIVILAAAICTKLWMAYFYNQVYKATDNLSIKAVRQDSLNDCIATGATIVALLISHFTGFNRADGIIGLIVSIVIFYQGIETVKELIGPLLGQAPSKELVESIKNIVLSKNEIVGIHDLIVHDYGPGRIIASVHAEVPANCDIVEIHEIIDSVEKEIASKLKIAICIHMDPIVIDDEHINNLKSQASRIIKGYNEKFSFHDFRVVNGKENINLVFDLVIPHDKSLKNSTIINDLERLFKAEDERLNLVLTIEHSYVEE